MQPSVSRDTVRSVLVQLDRMFQEPLRVDLVISGTGLRVRSVSLRPPSEDADVLPPPAVTDVPLGDAGRIRFEFAIKVTTNLLCGYSKEKISQSESL